MGFFNNKKISNKEEIKPDYNNFIQEEQKFSHDVNLQKPYNSEVYLSLLSKFFQNIEYLFRWSFSYPQTLGQNTSFSKKLNETNSIFINNTGQKSTTKNNTEFEILIKKEKYYTVDSSKDNFHSKININENKNYNSSEIEVEKNKQYSKMSLDELIHRIRQKNVKNRKNTKKSNLEFKSSLNLRKIKDGYKLNQLLSRENNNLHSCNKNQTKICNKSKLNSKLL